MADFTIALQQQIELLQTLKKCLDSELELVVSRDADALMALVNEKEKLLNAIDENDALLRSAPLELSQAQSELVETGKQLLQDCQKQTQVNALVVEKNQLRLQRIRNMMVSARNKESMTYTNKGKTHGGLLGNRIKA